MIDRADHEQLSKSPMRIALCGQISSGKSVVASHLVQNYGFEQHSFAHKLKTLCADLFGMEGKDRVLLQRLGAKLREVDNDVWLLYLVNRMPIDRDIVVSDVRYVNEYELLLDLGFLMLRMEVSRSSQLRRIKALYPGMPAYTLDDKSEHLLDRYKFDYTILNETDGEPLTVLHADVDKIMREVYGC